MPTWTKCVLRIIGTLNVAMVCFGAYAMFSAIRSVLFGIGVEFPSHTVFGVMTVINVLFLSVFLVTAVQLIRYRLSAVIPYSIAMVALFAYLKLVGSSWHMTGIGLSIAAATGIGNMGIAAFELLFVVPGAYPILSAAGLLLTKRFASQSHDHQAVQGD
jgi:hypothetical protein